MQCNKKKGKIEKGQGNAVTIGYIKIWIHGEEFKWDKLAEALKEKIEPKDRRGRSNTGTTKSINKEKRQTLAEKKLKQSRKRQRIKTK